MLLLQWTCHLKLTNDTALPVGVFYTGRREQECEWDREWDSEWHRDQWVLIYYLELYTLHWGRRWYREYDWRLMGRTHILQSVWYWRIYCIWFSHFMSPYGNATVLLILFTVPCFGPIPSVNNPQE